MPSENCSTHKVEENDHRRQRPTRQNRIGCCLCHRHADQVFCHAKGLTYNCVERVWQKVSLHDGCLCSHERNDMTNYDGEGCAQFAAP